MREKTLGFIGIMRRANAIETGEESVGEAVREGRAKLVLLASDISENSRKRAETFVYGKNALLVTLPFDKTELSQAVGTGCSMLAVTELGFASALMKKLCELDEESFKSSAEELDRRFDKAERRKAQKHGTDIRKSIGKRRTNT